MLSITLHKRQNSMDSGYLSCTVMYSPKKLGGIKGKALLRFSVLSGEISILVDPHAKRIVLISKMKYLIYFIVLFKITCANEIEESSTTINTVENSTTPEDSKFLDSTSTTTTIAPIVVPIITEDNGSGNTSISSELTITTEPESKVSEPVSNTNDNLLNSSLSKPSGEIETSKEDKNATLSSSEVTEPIILIPLKQNSAQSVVIPTLRAYQKYFVPSNPTKLDKRKITAFTDTATPCPTCGRMVCGNNGNFCPVCLHSGRSNLAAIEKSINLESEHAEEDPLALYGAALRNRRKNAWRVATILRPGSLAANQNKLPSELRAGRNLWSWFGNKASANSGQTSQRNEQIIVKPSSEFAQPTFLHEASNRPQVARICFYPERPVLIAPQTAISQRVSSIHTILSAFS